MITFGAPVGGSFGTPLSQGFREREGSYALIRNDQGRLLVVRGRRGLFLPGGGVDPGESPLEALHRELREECGLAILEPRFLGEACQWYSVDGVGIRMMARFWAAGAGEVLCPGEDDWAWLDPSACRGRFFHACHEAALGWE
jgi:8-oxo-dGTP pyrophosphatase MutT (NUDIX family)